jgi:hypothetical protein
MTQEQIEIIINNHVGGLKSVLYSYDEVYEICLKILEYIENEKEMQLPN